MENLRVIELSAQNYKIIRAIDITPDEHFQVISGGNGQGKTTATEIITSTLEGARSIKGDPITYGKDNAWTQVDLGELIARRTYKKDGKTTFKLWGKDGRKFSNPQTIIDALYGVMGFDPTKFMDMTPAEQAKVLRELANVDVDFAQIDIDNKADYDLRTGHNRDVKNTQATINELLPGIAGFTATEVIKLSEHMDQLEAAEKKVAELAELERQYDAVVGESDRLNDSMGDLNDQIKLLQNQIETISESYDKAHEKIDALESQIENFKVLAPEKIEAKRDYIKNIEAHNDKVKIKNRIDELEANLLASDVEADKCTKAMDERNKAATDAIAAAKLPVDGLSFTATGVTFDGEPFSSLSDGEKIRVSFYIGAASNPKIRVMICRKASLLDKKAMALLQELAIKEDIQIFVERVDAEAASIVIEAGEVVNDGKN